MSLSSSFGDEGTTESLIPPLMERPEICGWEEYPNYILSDNRNRSKSKERTDRASPVRSRSRYVWLTDLSWFSYINNTVVPKFKQIHCICDFEFLDLQEYYLKVIKAEALQE